MSQSPDKTICFTQQLENLKDLWENRIKPWEGDPPGLFSVNRTRLLKIQSKFNIEAEHGKVYKELEKRIPPKEFPKIRASVDAMLYYSEKLFPGFKWLMNEFINEEWLSLVDFHKNFHRDHIVHQVQTALVVKQLFEEIRFDIGANELTKGFIKTDAYQKSKKSYKRISLLDLTAYVLRERWPQLEYLFSFAESLGFTTEELKDFNLWKQIAYDAGIIAALYHDIGYPLQFLGTVESSLHNRTFKNIMNIMQVSKITKYFDNNLCLAPFKAYKWGSKYPFPHTYYQEYEKIIQQAMDKTHGLASALNFLYLNNEIRDWESSRENKKGILTMEISALAMLMHDMQKIYKPGKKARRAFMRVSFLRDPVSFLVTLADQIQNYARINAEFESNKGSNEQSTMTTPSHIKYSKLYWDKQNANLKIVYGIRNKASYIYKKHIESFIPQQEAEYFDPLEGFLDYSSLFSKINVGVELCF